jgi:hypothetical protein
MAPGVSAIFGKVAVDLRVQGQDFRLLCGHPGCSDPQVALCGVGDDPPVGRTEAPPITAREIGIDLESNPFSDVQIRLHQTHIRMGPGSVSGR